MPSTRRHSSRLDDDVLDNQAPNGRSRRSAVASGSRTVDPDEDEDDDRYEEPEEEDGDSDDDEEEDGNDGHDDDDEEEERISKPQARQTRSGRAVRANYVESADEDDDDDEDDEDRIQTRRRKRQRPLSRGNGFVVDDEEEDADAPFVGSKRKTKLRRAPSRSEKISELANKRSKGTYQTGEIEDPVSGMDGEDSDGHDGQGKSYAFRQRTKKVDYRLVAPPGEPLRDGFGRKIPSRGSRGDKGGSQYELDGMEPLPAIPGLPGIGTKRKGSGWNGLPTSMTGKDYDKLFGADDGDSSDEDIPASRKKGAGAAPAIFGGAPSADLLGAGAGALGGGGGADLGAHRDAMGRMKGTEALADIDPLGVNMQIDFNSVGGLDHHIQQLKEMVSLPLLYPEVFQRFKVTPPRGVLFHGPPGTGKTLVARALAASCSSSGQQISFFMRKGADCLSKWVGEAERQLRLLFEEARNSQPSIIFFDEIDGLAPVRSSKQDQIHASIVSTLLALMDGMDGRGQVVVIGATNRPDSVDPALRRPGRFDREFYFPLPNREGRKSIINIQTKEWEPALDDAFKDRLADVTKGYGGADLRALCTEAALNAIQRRYPQIYQTTDRLQLKPETIQVSAKDFMMSVNKVVPSSARSSSSAAAPLPAHLKPLLGESVQSTIQALEKVMPPATKRNPLEEALWEDDEGENHDGGFGRELLLQSFEQLRVFRPRLILHGERGMGQLYLGSALLHHLEGYHVQSLDVASLMGDSASTAEAVVIQMFNEAKRHKPSVLYIPALSQWASNVSESVRSTIKSLLDGLTPSDPITLLAVCDGPFQELPRDIRAWFGYLRDNRVELGTPTLQSRQAYFEEVLQYVTKPPSEFPDALPRKRRVLEELPIAPPRPPRVPTAAELRQQAADDARTLEILKYRLGPILMELRKKFPRFKRDVWQEYNLYELTQQFDWHKEKNKIVVALRYEPDSELLRKLKANSPVEEGDGLRGSQNVSRGASADVAIRVQAPENEQEAIEPVNGLAFGEADVAMTSEDQRTHQAVAFTEDNGSLAAPPMSAFAKAISGDTSNHKIAPSEGEDMPSYMAGFTRDQSGFFQRNLTIWNLNLEKVQRRLFENGYLTVSDFLGDINKILSNAIEAQEVDEDRATRAHQLHNLAVILLDQYCDETFRISCEKMAERTIAREAEAKAEAERARLEQEEAAKRPRMPTGERHSARIHGEAAEIGSLDDLAAIERKRSRKTSEEERGDLNGSFSHADDSGQQQAKRSRIDSLPMTLDLDQAAILGAGVPQGPSASLWESSAISPHLQPSAPAIFGESFASGSSTSAIPPYAQSTINSPIVHAGTPPPQMIPRPVHPPFSFDRRLLEQLLSQLLHQTSQFNVEQLEQLRAALFDAIWKQRAEWGRDKLLKDMMLILRDIVDIVEEDRREERAEREERET